MVLGGDLNVAHEEIDIHSPKTNKKSAGCALMWSQRFFPVNTASRKVYGRGAAIVCE